MMIRQEHIEKRLYCAKTYLSTNSALTPNAPLKLSIVKLL